MTASAHHREPIDILAEEFLDRFRRGERPAISEYAERHPELADDIHELFPTLVVMEQAGASATGSLAGSIAGFCCPERLGEFRILREVGRGGMGVIYDAVQEPLDRRVALKVLPLNTLLAPKHLARFQREARAAAQLHHRHIVPVFGVGVAQGVHYYAMQFIDGQSLDVVLRDILNMRQAEGIQHATLANGNGKSSAAPGSRKSTADTIAQAGADTDPVLRLSGSLTGQSQKEYYRRVARLGMQAADALAYAHSQDVVHRDIKPSNLIFDHTGHVWITDFGLAKHEGPSDLTQTGDVVGTLRYLAPEQLQGWADPRTDIHGLGLTLYELIALRPAYDAPTRGELIKQIADRMPPALSRWDQRVPRDLETIVAKSIAREPADRYSTAHELATSRVFRAPSQAATSMPIMAAIP